MFGGCLDYFTVTTMKKRYPSSYETCHRFALLLQRIQYFICVPCISFEQILNKKDERALTSE
jgi:hypothetical protein